MIALKLVLAVIMIVCNFCIGWQYGKHAYSCFEKRRWKAWQVWLLIFAFIAAVLEKQL